MEPSPSFSLIIPAYNEEKYIGACLDAVLKNASGLFEEIIVIDNASTDRTGKVARSFPGVRVIREPNKGLTHARQRGYKESRSTVLTYIDADMRPLAGWAEQIREAFERDPQLACLSGPYKYYDISAYAGISVTIWNWIAKFFSYLLGYMVYGGNFAIRREVLDKMQGFDETITFYGEDADIGRRAHAYGKIVFSLRLKIYTSGRRLKAQGFIRTGNLYAKNLIAIVASGRPTTMDYIDFR
jgi:glycosyltransferase involved in cell wall biosynthesis